jgi:hypothetical protein
MTKYSLFERLKGDTPLEKLLNQTFRALDIPKMICSPNHFNEEFLEKSAITYYHLELYESYCHKVVSKFKELQGELELYKKEFNDNWKDYATTKKQESINEFGYDETDYDEDGNLKPATVESLRYYDFFNRNLNYNCIIFNMKLENFSFIFSLIENSNDFSITKFPLFQNIDTYRNENGELVKNSFTDTVLSDAKTAHTSEMYVKLLAQVISSIEIVFESFREIESRNHNQWFFEQMEKYVDKVINLKFDLN